MNALYLLLPIFLRCCCFAASASSPSPSPSSSPSTSLSLSAPHQLPSPSPPPLPLLLPLSPSPSPSSSSSASPPPPPPAPAEASQETHDFQVSLEVLSDGVVTARDAKTREVKWSFSSGTPLTSANGFLLDAYKKKNSSTGITSDPVITDDQFIFCDTDWKLHVFDKSQGLGDLPVSAEKLVQNTPIIVKGALMLGTVTTSVVVLDGKSGATLHRFDSGNSTFTAENFEQKDPWDVLGSTYQGSRNKNSLFIFRKDYTIKSIAMTTGTLLWNVSIGEIWLHHSNPEEIHVNPGRMLSLPQSTKGESSKVIEGRLVQRALPSSSSEENNLKILPLEDVSEPNLRSGISMTKFQKIVAILMPILSCAVGTIFFWRSHKILNKEEKQEEKQEEKPVHKKKKGRKTKSSANVSSLVPSAVSSEIPNGVRSPIPTVISSPICIQEVENIRIEEMPVFLGRDSEDEYYVMDDLRISKKHIGNGSNGTIVFDGYMDKRAVAVKRMLVQYYDLARKEIEHLVKADEHPNIVRYFCVKFDDHFVYVVLERCRFSLNDLVLGLSCQYLGDHDGNVLPGGLSKEELQVFAKKVGDIQDWSLWDDKAWPSAQLIQFMRDIVEGLSHLHDVGIIHRDLKPHNVLISCGRKPQAKLSDMGISKQLDDGVTSLPCQSAVSGSCGWQAPEQLARESHSRSSDLFSLGCLLFFSISGGYHPFGALRERDQNISCGKMDLFRVEHVPEAMDLLPMLLHQDPKKRLNVKAVRMHPLFWTSDIRLKFLCDASDHVELDKESESPLVIDLEALQYSWGEKLDESFRQNIEKYRKYNFGSVRDLLRVIRNKSNHFRELPLEVQKLFEPFPEGFEMYFRRRFPKLSLHVFRIVERHCRDEDAFKNYFSYAHFMSTFGRPYQT